MGNIWVDIDLRVFKDDADTEAMLNLVRNEINGFRVAWREPQSIAMSDTQWDRLGQPHRLYGLVVSCPALGKLRPIQINQG